MSERVKGTEECTLKSENVIKIYIRNKTAIHILKTFKKPKLSRRNKNVLISLKLKFIKSLFIKVLGQSCKNRISK